MSKQCDIRDGRCIDCGSQCSGLCKAELGLDEIRAMRAGLIPKRAILILYYQLLQLEQGPGTELEKLMHKLDYDQKGCGCHKCNLMKHKMNQWGPDGCQKNRAEILTHLNDAYSRITRMEAVKITAKIISTGLLPRINPFNPAGSLLDLAIEASRKSNIYSDNRAGAATIA